MSNEVVTTASLYIVATPIGNLGDMTSRAIEVLKNVDLIAAEDTRHSARLLQHFGIGTQMRAYHDFSDDARVESLLEKVQSGRSVALISDAGTPLISDPGYRLVVRARELGIGVVPIPGASALTAAISVAGMPSDRFVFEGFPNAKSVSRIKQFEALGAESRSIIFYESPHRILESLADMQKVFGGERKVSICRELTKTFETVFTDSFDKVIEWMQADANQQRGEFVVIVAGLPKAEEEGLDEESLRILTILLEEFSVKQASALAARITGLKKNFLYQKALELAS
ncbi:MAG: 16S rRNA (cytidine(1402)-2'-O)-methyltransferase [Pseudohongiellaceae bacterium]|nr:16S rRNA (cytidine(1402)-2'-O)-methyltransferase [Pseudohongiellaceae bacterium]